MIRCRNITFFKYKVFVKNSASIHLTQTSSLRTNIDTVLKILSFYGIVHMFCIQRPISACQGEKCENQPYYLEHMENMREVSKLNIV